MEQKDYILREIEKIGLMLRKLLDRITMREYPSGTPSEEAGMLEWSGWLLEDTGCDLDQVLELRGSELGHYFSALKGFNAPNIELLGDILMTMGMRDEVPGPETYLEGAIRLYELCDQMERSFSLERDEKIRGIKRSLK